METINAVDSSSKDCIGGFTSSLNSFLYFVCSVVIGVDVVIGADYAEVRFFSR